ncbi:MAG: hypothetical protein V7L30_32030, partial [Nostoc sp.]
MEKKIDATLDLAKSLKDFEIQVTKLLELTNVSVWDGQVFKEREQKIRDSALILAGQCIALFLYNLSQSQDALDTAMTQTRLWSQPTTQRHGYRTRQILTIGNVLVNLKLPYLVTISEKKDKNKSSLPYWKWCSLSLIRQVVNLRIKGNSKFWLKENA